MIERINLIEKTPFKFSYSKLARAGIAIVALCALVYGGRFLQLKFYKDKVATLSETITTLKEEQQQLIKTVPKRTEPGAAGTLKSLFLQSPRWADMIEDISLRMPATLWLTSIKGVVRAAPKPGKDEKGKEKEKKDAAKEKDKGKDKDKKDEPAGFNLVLTGQSLRSEAVATFLSQLQESEFLTRTTLSSLKKTESGFSFTIECDMVAKQ